MTEGRRGLSQRVFAWMYRGDDSMDGHEKQVEPYKRKYLSDLRGDILEIGPGTGANFRYFHRDIRWIGVEPNVFMHDDLKATARKHGFTDTVRPLVAERLPADDSTIDAVVGTLVLCSVDDQAQALREILRVLRPGGRYVFLEHVAAPTGSLTRRVQNIIKPVWKALADGCHTNRETWKAIESAGFSQVQIDHFRVDYPIVAPHIAGVGIK